MMTWSWIISGFGIAALALILLIVSGVITQSNYVAAFIAFTCAAIFIAINRLVTQPRSGD
jgi:hypothetical protein